MIYAVRSNNPKFRPVHFEAGFNVVLAERTIESTEKDSRNGLGKSTLIEIIHFCLGARPDAASVLLRKELDDWTFMLDIRVAGRDYSFIRNTKSRQLIEVAGDTDDWPIAPEIDKKSKRLGWSVPKFNKVMGYLMFSLPITSDMPNEPSFRSLISYFARRGLDAFNDSFSNSRKQLSWDIKVHNAFLLGLGWEYAQKWQVLKERGENLKLLTQVRDTGSELLSSLVGSIGELEATRIQVEELVKRERSQLDSFQVHPEYSKIREEANSLTVRIHQFTNENIQDRRMLEMYSKDAREDFDPSVDTLVTLYKEASVIFSAEVIKRLEDVQEFHHRIVSNRREFLSSEIHRLQHDIANRDRQIRDLSGVRAQGMEILKTHGALEEYTELANRHARTIAQLNAINMRIESLRNLEREKSVLKIEMERLAVDAKADYEERKTRWQRAIKLFNSNSEALYEAPGSLIVDIDNKSSFQFKVDIDRDGSDAIEKMKVFCYDLMLAQLWAEQGTGPGFLIHDSTIFADVDERQRALALELAARLSVEIGFQYICCFNSDQLPQRDFSEHFNIEDYVRITLTDATVEGGLLGIRLKKVDI